MCMHWNVICSIQTGSLSTVTTFHNHVTQVWTYIISERSAGLADNLPPLSLTMRASSVAPSRPLRSGNLNEHQMWEIGPRAAAAAADGRQRRRPEY